VKRRVAVQLARVPPWYINDVALTRDAALFTDSVASRLFSLPRFFGPDEQPVATAYALGPRFAVLPGQFKSNGLAVLPPETASGKTNASSSDGSGGGEAEVLVANLHEGNFYQVALPSLAAAPRARGALFGPAAAGAAVSRVETPAVERKRLFLDGLWLEGSSTLYAADNFHNRVVRFELVRNQDGGGYKAEPTCVIAPQDYRTPTTLTMTNGDGGGRVLWAVNAHLTTCLPFVPCPSHKFELIGVRPQDFCS
jgi:hypothetical protein